jgi:hypothetical protein
LNEYATTTKFPLQISNQSKIETIINLFSKTHYTSKNQAATTRPKFKQPQRNQESSSHKATSNHTTKNQPATTRPRIKHPPSEQESTSQHATKNQAATTTPRIKQPPHKQESSATQLRITKRNQAYTM